MGADRSLKPAVSVLSAFPRHHVAMKKMRRVLSHTVAIALAATLACSLPATAGDDDHERAQRARERGEILPLERILLMVRERIGGEVVKIELEREHGRWIYEIKLIDKRDRLLELEVDAGNGDIIEIEED
jgi:uncharacterized membrane protein YkoI